VAVMTFPCVSAQAVAAGVGVLDGMMVGVAVSGLICVGGRVQVGSGVRASEVGVVTSAMLAASSAWAGRSVQAARRGSKSKNHQYFNTDMIA
jgi:hypothetical protein